MRTRVSPPQHRSGLVDWLRGNHIAILNGIAIGVLFAFACIEGGYVLMQMAYQVAH